MSKDILLPFFGIDPTLPTPEFPLWNHEAALPPILPKLQTLECPHLSLHPALANNLLHSRQQGQATSFKTRDKQKKKEKEKSQIFWS